jgi:hypothetical protein
MAHLRRKSQFPLFPGSIVDELSTNRPPIRHQSTQEKGEIKIIGTKVLLIFFSKIFEV